MSAFESHPNNSLNTELKAIITKTPIIVHTIIFTKVKSELSFETEFQTILPTNHATKSANTIPIPIKIIVTISLFFFEIYIY
jgi:hypothetical protein